MSVGFILEIALDNILISAILLIIVAAVTQYCLFPADKFHSDLPPGPRGYPIIGNVLEITGKDFATYCEECRLLYGDVFYLRIFWKTLIVFNGYEVLKDAFINNGDLFSERPKVTLTGSAGVVMSSGKQWKENRRFVLKTLRDFGMGKNTMQVKIHEEIDVIIAEIEKYNEKPFDIGPLVNCAISNLICSIVLGRRFAYDDVELQKNIERINKIGEDPNIFFGLKLLRYIPGDPFGVRASIQRIEECDKFYSDIIKEHFSGQNDTDAQDVIDVFIERMRKTDSTEIDTEYNKQHIKWIVSDLVGAGSETTATSIRWGVLYLLRDRDIQNKLYAEIQENVPRDRLPNVSDKLRLPYVEATVAEIMRLSNVAPLGIPHTTIQDVTFRGYRIPADASLLPNLQSVLYDGKLWTDPMKFIPKRFLNEEGRFMKREQFIPFSIGRRSCPGESLATMELFLFISALVQRFEFLPPVGEDIPPLECTRGVIRTPKSFSMRAVKRQRYK